MNTVILDGNTMVDKKCTHKYISESMNFPEYYGNNLDALYDILSSIVQETTIIINNSPSIEKNLGIYGTALIQVLKDSTEYNNNLHINLK